MSTYTNPRMRGHLTTDHAASSYGIPVLVIDGQTYGPADYLPAVDESTLGSDFFGTAPLREVLAGWHVLTAVDSERVQHDEFDGKVHPEPIVEAFLGAWHQSGIAEFERDVR